MWVTFLTAVIREQEPLSPIKTTGDEEKACCLWPRLLSLIMELRSLTKTPQLFGATEAAWRWGLALLLWEPGL